MRPLAAFPFADKSLDSYYRCKILTDYPSSNRLVLSLFSQPNLKQISIKQLIAWGELFEHEPATIRVAVGRLVKQGFLMAQQRGNYSIGSTDKSLNQLAAAWRDAPSRVTEWNRGWLCVYTAHLGRTSQKSILKRERAFRLTGFKPIEKNLWCRPDNLLESADCTFSRLVNIGLEKTAILMKVDHFNQDIAAKPMGLWSPKQLNATYNILVALLAKSAKRLSELELKQAAKESFLIGEHVIRQINQDPLLPEEIVDASARNALVLKMAEYDSVCHSIWHQFIYNS